MVRTGGPSRISRLPWRLSLAVRIAASDEGLATRLEKSFHTPLCMKPFGMMCTYLFTYCVDVEQPTNFLNRVFQRTGMDEQAREECHHTCKLA